MIGNLKAPIWLIPVLVLVMAIGAFTAVVALNHATAGPTEASNLDLGNTTTGPVDAGKLTAKVTATHKTTATTVSAGTANVVPGDPGHPRPLNSRAAGTPKTPPPTTKTRPGAAFTMSFRLSRAARGACA